MLSRKRFLTGLFLFSFASSNMHASDGRRRVVAYCPISGPECSGGGSYGVGSFVDCCAWICCFPFMAACCVKVNCEENCSKGKKMDRTRRADAMGGVGTLQIPEDAETVVVEEPVAQ